MIAIDSDSTDYGGYDLIAETAAVARAALEHLARKDSIPADLLADCLEPIRIAIRAKFTEGGNQQFLLAFRTSTTTLPMLGEVATLSRPTSQVAGTAALLGSPLEIDVPAVMARAKHGADYVMTIIPGRITFAGRDIWRAPLASVARFLWRELRSAEHELGEASAAHSHLASGSVSPDVESAANRRSEQAFTAHHEALRALSGFYEAACGPVGPYAIGEYLGVLSAGNLESSDPETLGKAQRRLAEAEARLDELMENERVFD